MIHRFLIFDRKFNCRLDRRYPLNQFIAFNESINKPPPSSTAAAIAVVNNQVNDTENKGDLNNSKDTWNTLVIKSDLESCEVSSNSLTSQFENLGISTPQQSQPQKEIVEHSQQLILGLTHSLKNMLMKLSPSIENQPNLRSSTFMEPDGYSFSFKTSKYRLYYFESITGWKLVMLTDCTQPSSNSSNNNSNNPNNLTPETVLKSFYTQILLKFLLTYPLGTIYTQEKSTETRKVFVENDFLHRAGFLSKMDEFIQSIDRIF